MQGDPMVKSATRMNPSRVKKTATIKCRIEARAFAALKSHCATTGQSMSVFVRRLLYREINSASEHDGAHRPAGSAEEQNSPDAASEARDPRNLVLVRGELMK
jgi:hypothetical protein